MDTVDLENIIKLSNQMNMHFAKKFDRAKRQALDNGAAQLYVGSNMFFSEKPKKICAIISNLIAEFDPASMPYVENKCKNINYSVYCNGVELITIWYISADLLAKLRTEDRLLKPKAYLIILYRLLYNPEFMDQYSENQKLVTAINKDSTAIYTSDKKTINTKFKESTINLADYLKTEVFVGPAAYKFYLNENISYPELIITESVSGTLKKLKDLNITHETQPFPILNDFTLTKTCVKHKSKVLCYIYNVAEYNLVPFIKSAVCIGNIYLCAQFALISSFSEYKHYFYKIHDQLITISSVSMPNIKNYYGQYKSETRLFKACQSDQTYKPVITKKVLNKYIYF